MANYHNPQYKALMIPSNHLSLPSSHSHFPEHPHSSHSPHFPYRMAPPSSSHDIKCADGTRSVGRNFDFRSPLFTLLHLLRDSCRKGDKLIVERLLKSALSLFYRSVRFNSTAMPGSAIFLLRFPAFFANDFHSWPWFKPYKSHGSIGLEAETNVAEKLFVGFNAVKDI